MHRWIEHTSEVELLVEAESKEAVFAEAALALGELLTDESDADNGIVRRELSVRARDLPALLATWLEELVFIAETEGLVPERVVEVDVDAGEARGMIEGRRSLPQTLVKAITYHRLEMRPIETGWRGRVVFDV